MAGFDTLDDIGKANSVNNRGQRWMFSKGTNAIAPVAGRAYSMWPQPGSPGAGSFPGTARSATQLLSTTTGAMFFSNPGTGRTNHLTAFIAALSGALEGDLYLCDRLLSYDQFAVNTTADQTTSGAATLPRYTDGTGNQILVEVDTLLSAGAGTLNITYTNTTADGSSATRVGSKAIETGATAAPCRVPYADGVFHPLQGSDRGVKNIVKANFSGGTTFTSGQLCISIVHPLWQIPVIKGQNPDLLSQVVHQTKIEDNACLMFVFVPYTATAQTFTGICCTTEN